MSIDPLWFKGDISQITENTEDVLKNYILHPEISIHDPDPEILVRKPNIEKLYYLPECPASTTLIPKRDYETGKIIDFIEVEIQDAGANSKNSTSLQRAPGPLSEATRGSAMNFPFWPGGFDEPSKEIESLQIDDFDFENNLLTIPPGFIEGMDFSNTQKGSQNTDNIVDTVNLLETLEQEHDIQEWLKDDNRKEKEITTDVENINTNELSDDTIISGIGAILKIHNVETTKTHWDWAEMVDISQPVLDFKEKIPEPAMEYPFELDIFQKQAILKLEERQHVFVAAHTSAGKTVVAEYAIALSQKHMTTTIYTSPIKALSNQKYRDFKNTFKDVGLITGDLQIEPTASCLIMTTEILRSMLYCGSDRTRDLEYVIFDEVHYINDSDRGHVWEEVLILLPDHVNIIMLSATVPNTLEFASWVGNTKKRKVYVISTLKRPVPLMHYLYTGCGGKTRNDKFLIVDETGQFLSANYRIAFNKKSEQKERRITDKYDQTLWVGLIDHLTRDDKLPVIAFTLSRRRCDSNVDALKSCNLNTGREKCLVKMFFQQCLQKLKEPDRILPQVLKLQDSLERGIGIHHSGILPILKEIVEMLFQRGLVKLLFATETFAMGVNMPARTVLFDSIEKYDGNCVRMLEPAEYIQMAGRAGRRGHDRNGTVILICKQKVPTEMQLLEIMQGAPEKLSSRFLLTYSMILTCLRLENLTVEDLMTHSFKEFHTQSKLPEIDKTLKKTEENISNLKELDEHLKPLSRFYDLASSYISQMKEIMKNLSSLPKVVKELKPGRVLIISYENHYNKLAIFISTSQKVNDVFYNVLVLDHEESTKDAINEQKSSSKKLERGELWDKMLSLIPQNKYYYPESVGGHTILKIRPSDINEITKSTIKIDAKTILQNWETRQIPRFKTSPPGPTVVKAVTELYNLNDSYLTNPTIIQSIDLLRDFNLTTDNDLNINTIENVQQIKKELKEILPYTNIGNFEQEFALVFDRRELEKKLANLKHMKSNESLSLYPDYCNKLDVLKEFNYIDENLEVTMKGRVACEMGQQELIIIELVLRNIFTDLNAAEIAALLSSLVFQAKTDIEPELTDKLKAARKIMEEVERDISKVEDFCRVTTSTTKERLNFGLAEVVYKWANNKPFAEIMECTDIQEGIIVRCIQQLDEALRDVKTAALRIGNPTLQSKMEEAITAIKRDIVFAASLYTSL